MKELKFINKNNHPVNLMTFLHTENGVSRKLITRLKRQRPGITCEGKLIRTIDDVPAGAEVLLHIDDEEALEPNGNIPVDIVYEDENTVVFDKPQKMPVHPSINHYYDTLGNFFSYCYPNTTFRAVNRLDRNTSGLCVIAKDQHTAYRLQHNIKKVYFAVVCGCIEENGVIDAPIARETESMIKRHVHPDGQRAVTHYTVISACEKYTYLRIELETGRTHQIRVHFSYIGHPLAGDDLYGGNTEDIQCQALHCGEIIFPDNAGNIINLSVPPHQDMQNIIKKYLQV